MARLTTHVLDTTRGAPAAGMKVTLHSAGRLLATVTLNSDGRCDAPLLEDPDFPPGAYELRFHLRDYFTAAGLDCPFLDTVPVAFEAEAGRSCHVPLVCSPWAYSTYRGS